MTTTAGSGPRRSRRRQPGRARGDDGEALECLLLPVRRDIHRLVLRMTACPDDARDATREILIKVMTRLSTFRGQAAVRTWAHRVALNTSSPPQEHRRTTRADLLTARRRPPSRPGGRRTDRPDHDVLARDVKHGRTLAMLTCLDRDLRVVRASILDGAGSTGA